MISATLALAALSAAVSGAVSYGMLRAAVNYIEKQLTRIEAQLERLNLAVAAHETGIAVLKATAPMPVQPNGVKV